MYTVMCREGHAATHCCVRKRSQLRQGKAYVIQIHSSKNWLSKKRSRRSVLPPFSCFSLLPDSKLRLSDENGILVLLRAAGNYCYGGLLLSMMVGHTTSVGCAMGMLIKTCAPQRQHPSCHNQYQIKC